MDEERRSRQGRRSRSIVITAVGLAVGAGIGLWALGRLDLQSAYVLVVRSLPLVPLALAIEGARIGTETLAARSLFRAMKSPIPLGVLARAQLFGYSVSNVLPIGRVASEVTKATVLSSHAALANTSAVATVAQALHLLASACILLPCVVAARSDHTSFALSATLLGQCALLAAAGGGLLLAAYFAPVRGGWLQRLPKVGAVLEKFRAAMRKLPSFPWAASSWLVLNRFLQVVLLGVLVHAVGTTFSVARPFVALAVVITGNSAFDFVPGQVGALEGAFGLFAPTMQLSPAAALAVALLVHLVQFSWVLLGAGTMLVARGRRASLAIAGAARMATSPLSS